MGSLSIWHWLIVLVIVPIWLGVGFLPTIIALARGHRNKLAIILVNVLAGWTGVGWLVALVWSVLKERPPESAST